MEAKLIPGTKGFLATSDGLILDPCGNPRTLYTNGDGYQTASVLLDNGLWRTFGVHRLVALAHISCPGDPSYFTVNHRDTQITNNSVANLEWVSVKLNNIHASLMRGSKYRPMVVASSVTGEVRFIDNLQKLAKLIQVDIGTAWDLVKDEIPIDGWVYRFHSCKTKIPETLKKDSFSAKRQNGIVVAKPIRVLDVSSQEEMTFDSMNQAANYFKTSASHIFQVVCKSGNKRLFKKKYLVVEGDEKFPELTQDEYDELLNPCGREVLAYNEDEKLFSVWKSASSFIKEYGLSKKAVATDLKKGRLRLIHGWWFTYMKNKSNVERLKSMANCPE